MMGEVADSPVSGRSLVPSERITPMSPSWVWIKSSVGEIHCERNPFVADVILRQAPPVAAAT